MHATILLDAILAAIRDAMACGDNALADALATVLARATKATADVAAARVVYRACRLAKRPEGFGSGDGLESYRHRRGPDPITSPRGADAAAATVRDAFRARSRKGTIPREPNPLPLPRRPDSAGALGLVPSRRMRGPTFLA